MFKKTCILGFILIFSLYFLKCIFFFLKDFQLVEFKPNGVIFVLDISNSDRNIRQLEEKTILKICKKLDFEDKSKIYVLNEDVFLVYNEAPNNRGAIKNTFAQYSKFDKNSTGAAYGLALKKAVNDALILKKQGYKPSIVFLGDLENKGALDKQINWDRLNKNISNTMKYIPDLSFVFLFAHPQKLESSRERLKNVVPDNQLFVAPEESVNLTVDNFLQSIGR